MFGLSVGKILVVLVAIIAVFAATRMLRRIGDARSTKENLEKPVADNAVEDLAQCPKCGVFISPTSADHVCGKS
jgi:Sec-independent protein translocase protein TatA